MSHLRPSLLRSCLGLCSLALFTVAGCTVAPSPATPTPPAAVVLPADARALAYGTTVDQVLQNPEVGPKIRALFGPDWADSSPGRVHLVPGAQTYFVRGPLRMVRIGTTDYIAVGSCPPSDCNRRHVLVLIEEGGARLFARLDEGGFVHYYAFGADVTRGTATLIADSAFHVLYGPGAPYYAKHQP